jgi:anti-sigma factor RsiW
MISRRNKELQRYHDGDLSRRRAERVRRLLENSPEDRERLANLETMGGMLRSSSAAAVEDVSFDRLWAGIQAGVERQRPLGFGEKLRLWLRQYGLVAASAAAAAVLALFLLQPFFGDPSQAGSNDCEVESFDADPSAVSTIFTIYSPDKDGRTTVIWISDAPGEPTPPEGEPN